MPLSDKCYSQDELLTAAKDNAIPEEYFPAFLRYVENEIHEMEQDNERLLSDFSASDICRLAKEWAIQYFKMYDQEVKKGHGKEWSDFYAINCLDTEEPLFWHTYRDVYKVNPELAVEEIKVHCKAIGGDEHFINAFVLLLEHVIDSDSIESIPQRAIVYSDIYKEQIKRGESEVYAHKYAFLKSAIDVLNTEHVSKFRHVVELGCLAEAKEYEKALKEGRSEMYADIYADRMSDYIANYCTSYEEALNDELYKLEKLNIENELSHLK